MFCFLFCFNDISSILNFKGKKREKRITWLEAFHLLKRVALRRYRIKYFSDYGEQAAIRDVANKESGQEIEHVSVPNRTKKTSKKAIISSVNPLNYENFQTAELDTYEFNDNNLAEIILTNIVEEIKSRSNSTRESSPHTSRQSKRRLSVYSDKESDRKNSNKLENFQPYKMVTLNNHAKNPNENVIDKLKKIETSGLNHLSTDELSEQRPLISINGSKFIQTKGFQLENSILFNNAESKINVKPKERDKREENFEKKKLKAIIGSNSDSISQEKQAVLNDKTDKNGSKASDATIDSKIDSKTVKPLVNQEAKNKPKIQIDKVTNLFEVRNVDNQSKKIGFSEAEKRLEKKIITEKSSNENEQKILTDSNKTLITKEQEPFIRMAANNREIKVNPEIQQINRINQSIKKISEHETSKERLNEKIIDNVKKETRKISEIIKNQYSKEDKIESLNNLSKYKLQIEQEKHLNKVNEEKRLMNLNTPSKSNTSFEKSSIRKSKISKNHSKLKIPEKMIKVLKQGNLLTRDDLKKISNPTKLESIKEENSKNLFKKSIKQSKRMTKPKKGASNFKTTKRRLQKVIKKDNEEKKIKNKLESEKSKRKQGNSIENLLANIDNIIPSYENRDHHKPFFLESNNTFVETISGTSIHESDASYIASSENELHYKEFPQNLYSYEQAQNECINLEDNRHEEQNIVYSDENLFLNNRNRLINETQVIPNNQIGENASITRLKDDLSDTLNIIDEEVIVENNEISQELNYSNKHESFLDRTSTPKSDLEDKFKNEQDKTESESHDKSLEFQFIRIEMKDKTQESIKISDEIAPKTDEISQPFEDNQAARDDKPIIEEPIESAVLVDERSSSEYDESSNGFLSKNENTLVEIQVENELLNEQNKIRENSENIIEMLETIPIIFVEQSTIETPFDEEKNNGQDGQVSFQDYEEEEIQIKLDSEIIDVKPTDQIEFPSRNTPLKQDSFSISENESNEFEKNEINSDYNLSMFEKFLSHNNNNINLNKKRKSEVPSPLLFSMGFYDDSSSDEDLTPDSKIKYSNCALQALLINRK